VLETELQEALPLPAWLALPEPPERMGLQRELREHPAQARAFLSRSAVARTGGR
jgi:hypothetical protein